MGVERSSVEFVALVELLADEAAEERDAGGEQGPAYEDCAALRRARLMVRLAHGPDQACRGRTSAANMSSSALVSGSGAIGASTNLEKPFSRNLSRIVADPRSARGDDARPGRCPACSFAENERNRSGISPSV